MKSQRDKVIEILEKNGRIDNFWAIDNRLTLRLGDHIYDLRREGWEIATEYEGKNCVYKVIRFPAAKQLNLI